MTTLQVVGLLKTPHAPIDDRNTLLHNKRRICYDVTQLGSCRRPLEAGTLTRRTGRRCTMLCWLRWMVKCDSRSRVTGSRSREVTLITSRTSAASSLDDAVLR